MSDVLSQNERLFYFKTPLGPDKLIITSLDGTEAISELFHLDLELVSEDPAVDIKNLIGKPVSIGIRLADGSTFRYFHGIVSRARAITSAGRLFKYSAEVVPEVWRLTKTQDCRVFQNVSVPDIINEVLSRFGITDKQIKVSGQHLSWVYCVQYRETAWDFLNRLMETEGIFYFFKHEEAKTTLIVADAAAEHQPCPGQGRFKLDQAFGRGYNRDEDVVFKWELSQSFRSGKYTHRDFNYEDPTTDLTHEEPARESIGGNSSYEVYDFPGEYEDRGDASNYGKLRQEEEEVEQESISGLGNGRVFMPGFKFDLSNHELRSQNRSYVITSVNHHATEGSLLPDAAGSDSSYSNSFTCIPYSVPYRPRRKTPKHVMRGVQTATVVGTSGQELYTEEMGRIKVQFHWDRIGEKNENSSLWCRVMQPWAGNDYGCNFMPRIGDEVVVDFVEGDPDRPIIIGSVYNPVRANPWTMPDRMNWSGIKTKSTQGGDADDASELRFDDTAGSELVLLRSQKDMEITVENDLNEEIGKDIHRTVRGKTYLNVTSDVHTTVDANTITKVGGNTDLTVSGNVTESVSGNFSQSVSGNFDQSVSGNQSISVTGNYSLSVTGKAAISATGGVALICSGSHVYVNPSGVVVQGPMLYLNCGMPNGGPPTSAMAKTAQSPTAATVPDKYQLK